MRFCQHIFIVLLAALTPLMVHSEERISPDSVREIAREAYTFGASYVDNYRVYLKGIIDENHPVRLTPNEFHHLRRLVGPEFGDTPNNDTLFSYAILDLRREPVVISVPKVTDDRLYMLQFGEVSTNTLPYISSVATGTEAGDYAIVGPDYVGYLPADRFDGIITTRGQLVAVTGRTSVNGADDLSAVTAIQDQYTITPLSRFLALPTPQDVAEFNFIPWRPEKAAGLGYFDYVNMALAWQLPTLGEVPMFARFAQIGVIPGIKFSTDGMSSEIVDALQAGMDEARRAIMKRADRLQRDVGGGWLLGIEDLSRVGSDYLLRAAISSSTIYPNAPDHALYPLARHDMDGDRLTGSRSYRLSFEAGKLPPVDGFWSLTIYDAETTAMVPNPIDRYSIGDRTEGLVTREDGSLTICIQQSEPSQADCNWLPAPTGEFYLVIRLYMPKPEVLSGDWAPPPIIRE